MLLGELSQLISSTAEPGFITDHRGIIILWNDAMTQLMGVSSQKAIGQLCRDLIWGTDECGTSLFTDDSSLPGSSKEEALPAVDLEIQTYKGKQWCSVCVLVSSRSPSFAIYLVRPIDVEKRLVLLLRDYVASQTKLRSKKMITNRIYLTQREKQILRLVASGATTPQVAVRLEISRATAGNHIQHILTKLRAHTRLEAIRRAEAAGLL